MTANVGVGNHSQATESRGGILGLEIGDPRILPPGDRWGCSPPFWNSWANQKQGQSETGIGPLRILVLAEKPMRPIALNRESKAIGSSREITHMQVGQCDSQEGHTEVLCRKRRAARAIPARDNFPQYR
jgi:hypothetical protein